LRQLLIRWGRSPFFLVWIGALRGNLPLLNSAIVWIAFSRTRLASSPPFCSPPTNDIHSEKRLSGFGLRFRPLLNSFFFLPLFQQHSTVTPSDEVPVPSRKYPSLLHEGAPPGLAPSVAQRLPLVLSFSRPRVFVPYTLLLQPCLMSFISPSRTYA